MRNAFARTLLEIARADPRVWLVCGDLGYGVLDEFARELPDQFLNAGVAEQNMLGVAAGLALAGKIPFVYSIVNFPVMRCLEQVRNDVAYHQLNVKVVTVGGGLVYGGHGYTHHGAEDLGVMRLMPHMTVIAPGDPIEAAWATREAMTPGPVYLRLAKGGEPIVHRDTSAQWTAGQPIAIRAGDGVTLASTGGMLPATLAAADLLAERGIRAAVFSVPYLSPLDPESLFESARSTGRLVSIEDHGVGGLGTILAERLALRHEVFAFQPMRISREPLTVAGTTDELLARHGLSPLLIADAAVGHD